jgi:hypothetical protein
MRRNKKSGDGKAITKYGDIGTPERHRKFGGVRQDVVDGQKRGKGVENYLDVFLELKIWDMKQYNAAYTLIRDRQKGYLWEWKHVREYGSSGGIAITREEFEEERDKARKAYDAALRYNREFGIIGDFANIVLEEIGVRIPSVWKLQQLADRLIKYYAINQRS